MTVNLVLSHDLHPPNGLILFKLANYMPYYEPYMSMHFFNTMYLNFMTNHLSKFVSQGFPISLITAISGNTLNLNIDYMVS